jgi:hypothetical protein
MTIRHLVATGLASAALLGGAWTGLAGASAAISHGSHSHCVPAGQTGPGKPCTPKPKPTHVPKPKPSNTGTPHQHHTSHTHTPKPTP